MDTPDLPFTLQRRQRYAKALSSYPHARKLEIAPFVALLGEYAPDAPRTVLEIGSGSGFLTKELLGHGCTVDTIDAAFEPVPGVRSHYSWDARQGLPPDLAPEEYSCIVSLAALHHICTADSRRPVALLQDLSSSGGRSTKLLFADVPPSRLATDQTGPAGTDEEECFTATFFRTVVDRYSSPAHAGIYVDLRRELEPLTDAGWHTIEGGVYACPWFFDSEADVLTFLRTLFNLDESLTDASLAAMVASGLTLANRGIRLDWTLQYLLMERTE